MLAQAWWLLAVGVASLLAGWFYTGGKHPYVWIRPGWEVGVFLFFGLAAVWAPNTRCAAQWTSADYWVLAAGCFSCLIMMVNNIRDIDEGS